VCEGFCWVEVPPSPKVQAKAGEPEQLVGVAVDWKLTGKPTLPPAGTVAVQATMQASEIMMLPFLMQSMPSAVAVRVQL